MSRTKDLSADEDIAYLLGSPLTSVDKSNLLKNKKPLILMERPINSAQEEFFLDREIAYLSGSDLTPEEVSEIYSRYN
jgi:hypothetical protein